MPFASKVGFNAAWTYYFHEDYAFADYMKGASRWLAGSGWANQAEFNAYIAARSGGEVSDWLPSLPAGKQAYCIVKEEPFDYTLGGTWPVDTRYARTHRQGVFYVTWTGSATVTVNANDNTATVTTPSANRIQIDTGTTGLRSLYVYVQNATGAAITVDSVKVFHSTDEANVNAGKVLSTLALPKFTGAKTVRALDLVRTMTWGLLTREDVSLPLTNYIGTSDIGTFASRRWFNIPPDVLGKLATEISTHNNGLPCDIWVPVPVRMNQAAWGQYVTTLFANHPSGKLKVEAGNEVWNFAYPFNEQSNWYNQVYIRGDENGGTATQRTVYSGTGAAYPTPYTVTGTLGGYTYSYATTGSSGTIDSGNAFRMVSFGDTATAGFQVVAPAGTLQRTLTLFVFGYSSSGAGNQCVLEASLSDGSVAAISVNYSLVNVGSDNALRATITYRANSAGQTLTAIWRFSDAATTKAVHIQGAAVTAGVGAGAPVLNGAVAVESTSPVDLTAGGYEDYWVYSNTATLPDGYRKSGGGSQLTVTEYDPTNFYGAQTYEPKEAYRRLTATDSTAGGTTYTPIPSWEIAQSMNAHQAVQRWTAAEAVYGRSRVVRLLAGQSTNQGVSVYQLLTQTSSLGATDTVAKKMDEWAIGNYIYMGNAAANSSYRADTAMAEKMYAQVNAQTLYYNTLKNYIDYTLVPAMAAAQADLTAKGATQATMVAYECWRHTNTFGYAPLQGSLSKFTVNTGDNTLIYNPDTAGAYSAYSITTRDQAFDTGEVLRIESATGTPIGTTYPNNQVYIRRVSTDKLSLHPTLADANNNTNIIALSAATDVIGINLTRSKGMEDLQRAFAESELGRQLFVYWWNTTIKPYFSEANIYVQSGLWNDGYGASWGLVKNQFTSDTPVAVQARKMNNIGLTAAALLS